MRTFEIPLSVSITSLHKTIGFYSVFIIFLNNFYNFAVFYTMGRAEVLRGCSTLLRKQAGAMSALKASEDSHSQRLF